MKWFYSHIVMWNPVTTREAMYVSAFYTVIIFILVYVIGSMFF